MIGVSVNALPTINIKKTIKDSQADNVTIVSEREIYKEPVRTVQTEFTMESFEEC